LNENKILNNLSIDRFGKEKESLLQNYLVGIKFRSYIGKTEKGKTEIFFLMMGQIHNGI
jgi:hypothetical protein